MSWLKPLEDRYMPGLRQMHPASLALILFLVWVMIAGLLAGFWLMPAWRSWKALDAERAVLEGQTALPASALGDPARIRQDIEALENQLFSVPHGLTRGAIAMEQIRQSALNGGIHQAEVRMAGDGGKDAQLRFDVELHGSYGQLGSWLERVPQDLPWMELKRLRFSRSTAGDRHGALLLNAQVALAVEGGQGAKP